MKGKGKNIYILLIVLLSSMKMEGQISNMFAENRHIDSADVKKMYLEVDAVSFFKDNEFTVEKVKGYTLPGFRFSTQLSLAMSENVQMEVGLNVLRYWGGEAYPCYSYMAISEWESDRYHNGLHVIPIMRGQFSITDSLHLIIGSLYNINNHSLLKPMYNTELNYTADPEAGIQILYSNKYYLSDIWVNWQSFIFKNDNHQELFTFGYSSATKILKNDKGLNIFVPLQFVAQHRGGEINISEHREVQTASNYLIGLNTMYYFGGEKIRYISLGCTYVGYMQNTGTLYPLNNGWGIYPELAVKAYDVKFTFSYWLSKDFIALLGSPHFSNLSQRTPDMSFDEMDMFMIDMEYCYMKNKYFSFGVEGSYIHYFPYTFSRPEYGELSSPSGDAFAFGLFLRINPRIRILNLKSRIDD